MIALDTNILARFYVADPSDPEAAKQRPIAYELLTRHPSLFVPLTVVLELEWVLRAFYRFEVADIIRVFERLPGLANVHVEQADRVVNALERLAQGLDFADALHLSGCAHCEVFYTFDDRRFARRAQRLVTEPPVSVPMLRTANAWGAWANSII
ncbi:type II toxin-antitoxin system VapC family toxin [Allochromatium tepidum]|uniref:PIN domain-containing protein n=1 Tax=Allochromatium tepidum TaxID=553982 RepID=A0ABN6GCA9_9GAMM|nr:type II toxin-antitoxin system VapC family toxin [Allochromatium tepidum]BCU07529.1 hypothetical protein Atep_22060 [Allochromatium tepidum]